VEGSSALWGTKDIEDKLRRKLGAKFFLFMDVVTDVGKLSLRISYADKRF